MKQEDVDYMRLALQEANKGRGRTSPNPCVGAIIVRDNVVVGKGYHRKAGTPHAEVNSIADAGSKTVHEFHGSLKKTVCLSCRAKYPISAII